MVTPYLPVPDWGFWENAGGAGAGAVAVADLDGDGRPELVVFAVDSPAGANRGLYRIGRGLDATGAVTGGWGPWNEVPGWGFWENAGGGVAVADLDGDGRPELVVFAVDSPEGQDSAYYQVGWGLDADGTVTGGWSLWQPVPDWGFWENAPGGIAAAELDGDGRPELVLLVVDSPPGPNAGYVATLPPVLDIHTARAVGAWRLLPFDSRVLAIHAALLHTGQLLIFAGSSNNPDRAGGDFRSVVLDPNDGSVVVPATPADFFCAGHAFLADGRLLVAGSTKEYDAGHPFFGLRDAFLFDPATNQWSRTSDMAGGRWYPALVTLGDGRVVAMSGLGENGEDPDQLVEIYRDGTGWSPLPAQLNARWPLYAHLVLLGDGRLLYSGGYFGEDFDGIKPRLIDVAAGAFSDIDGLPQQDRRNQSATVLLPPAQEQRVLVMGGGAYTGEGHATHEATDSTAIVDLTAATPAYVPAAPLLEPRMHLNAVLLPDRTVLVCGGSREYESREKAALEAELFDPGAGTWTLGAASRVPRLYHSVAILLPDGSVVTAGSNPMRMDEDLRMERYVPPYLFRGPRPVVTGAPREISYGATIDIACPQAADVHEVSLVKPRATTHSSDSEQRLVALPFTPAPGAVRASVVDSPNLAPPGWYMIFVTNRAGVPSVAHWVHLT